MACVLMCVCGYALVVRARRVRAPLRAPLFAPRARARGLSEAPVATLPSRGSERGPFFFFLRCRLPFANRCEPRRRWNFYFYFYFYFIFCFLDASSHSILVVSHGAARVFICFM